jgi:hypothetical protein
MYDLFDFLPPNVVTHFRPEGAFLDWFVGHVAGRFTVEVGAGQCEFSKALAQLGVKILAVEPRPSPEVTEACSNFLLPVSVERAAIVQNPGIVVVAARPDHSGWFEELIEMVSSEAELLYIGLEKNFNLDIPEYASVEELCRDAGEDGEVVLRVRPEYA